MNKKNNNQKFIYVVLEEGEYDRCFTDYQEADKYCKEMDYDYDIGSWYIIAIPVKDLTRLL